MLRFTKRLAVGQTLNERKTHWLRQNAAARIPRRVICFDTEAHLNRSIQQQEHSFRLASLSFDQLDENARTITPTTNLDFGTPEALWGYIASFTHRKHRTVAFAHNLSYDLRLSNGLGLLPTFGFECKGIALNTYSCWAQFSDGARTLWLCDSLSFVPAALDKLGELTKQHKPPLPEDEDDDEVWLKRCQSDVAITRESILRVLRFIKDDNLGDFRLTGAAQASAAFRHRFLEPKSLLVHDNEDALAAERRAAWAGRAEVWTHGKTTQTVYEYDYEYAYTRLAHDLELPVKLVAEHSGIPWHRLEKVMEKYAVLADVHVATDVPIVPTNHDGHICWPSGTFDTTLWDSELRLLRSTGASIEVKRYWFYKKEPLLREWADWMMAKLNLDSRQLDPVIRVMLKDWSRALIGRFGLRYASMELIAHVERSDVCHRGVWNVDEECEETHLQLGHQLFQQSERVESPNSTPMVMSAIMAAARVRLWDAMQAAGLENIYYVDTDGLIVGRQGSRGLDSAIRQGLLPGMRRKSAYNGGSFRAPRNIDLGEQRRVSGAPRKAERLAHGVYRGEIWESLPAALRRRHIGKVFVHERTFTISDNDPRRIHLPNGVTTSIVLPLEQQEEIAGAA